MKDLLQLLVDLDIIYELKVIDDKIEVILKGRDITIHHTDTYWRYPGLDSYFVNYYKDSNNFSLNAGTTSLNQVAYLLGTLSNKA